MKAVVAGVVPDPEAVEIADVAAAQIQSYLSRHDESSVVVLGVEAESQQLTLPRDAIVLLARVLAYMANGQAVSVVPTHAELTTQQAAELLNVSRPYLIGLLEAGAIDHRKVGSHRRVRMQSLMDYKRQDDVRRREAADELAAESRELGLE